MENMLVILNNTVKQQSKSLLLQATTIKQQATAIQQHGTTIQQQGTTIQQQGTTIQQQGTTIQQQGTTIHQQATDIQQQGTTIQLQQTEIRQLQSTQGTGSTYIIWGRKQCPNNTDTEQVYSGYVGGGMYDQPGSAAEYVCLPPDPDFGRTSGYDNGRMYGAEYETNFFGTADEDVPCAVCRKTSSTSILMIPGKNKCYYGWDMEYHGYLGSGEYDHAAASSYVCVDSRPEYLNGGVQNENGKLFYSVLAKCGALQCPPYMNNYPLTCVVCSK
ncbi:short-chain collagen C4-like [Mytilus californianus]|uniref:short-chain collagen C4-like n=1 Tax=Mytilus californianus TaxID=6549 RepID=UPI00224534F5|nr:short-chain collagen C4-like [Mytilus californianus]